MISKKELEYLNNKHKGGCNNAKGNKYESFYAVRILSSLLHQYQTSLTSVTIQSQVPLTYVDDLLVCENNKHIYHQIKDVKNLSWGTKKHQSLKYDFCKQKALCKKRREVFSLKLVHSHSSDKVGDIPLGLRRCTIVELFPAMNDLNSLVLTDIGFQQDLRCLLYNGSVLPLDKLSDFSLCILGAWDGCPSIGIVSLQYFDLVLSRLFPGYIGNVTATISSECEAVFSSIGVDYWVTGSNVNIRWGRLEASFEWSSDLENLIVEAAPGSPIELFNLAK